MAGVALFSYQPAGSRLHAFDPRAKLLALAGISISVLTSGMLAAALIAGAVALLYGAAQLSLWRTVRRARLFLLLAAFVFISRSVSFGSSHAAREELLLFNWLLLSPSGAKAGALFALRFLTLFFAAHLFVQTTSRGAIVRSIQWYCSFLPAVPSADVALMAGLSLSFVSVLTVESSQLRFALALRAGPFRKNRMIWIRYLSRELVRRAVLRSGEIAQALVARGYSGGSRRPLFPRRRKEWLLTAVTVALTAAVTTALSATLPHF